MPWCEDCAKYWAPSAMGEEGECPTCGRVLEAPTPKGRVTAKSLDLKSLAAGETADAADEETARAPWHFKLLVVLLCIYLAWRFVQIFA